MGCEFRGESDTRCIRARRVDAPEIFIKAMRTGKHLGNGRPILPPMPWYGIGQLTDDDLQAVFANLRSLKAVSNLVPAPIPPTGARPGRGP